MDFTIKDESLLVKDFEAGLQKSIGKSGIKRKRN